MARGSAAVSRRLVSIVVSSFVLWLTLSGTQNTTASSPAQILAEYPTVASYMAQDMAALYPTKVGEAWVSGGGATAIQTFVSNLVSMASGSFDNFFLTYSPLGTSRGICRLLSYSSECKQLWNGLGTDIQRPTSLDFAIATTGATNANYNKYPDLQAYPFAAAAVALVHNIQNLSQPLVLSRSMAAKIFRKCDLSGTGCQPDDIRFWNDSRILALNPGQSDALNAAGEIQVFVRRDSAGITSVAKNAFAIFDPTGFGVQLAGAIDDSSNWTSVDAVQVYGLQSLAALVTATPSSVGYVSLDMVPSLNLQVIGLVLNDSSPRTSAVFPSLSTTQSGVLQRALDYGSAGSSPPSRRLVNFNGATNYNAYPIVMGAYLLVRLNSTRINGDCQDRQSLLEFARFLFNSSNGASVKQIATLSSAVMLPDDVLKDNLADMESKMICENLANVATILNNGTESFSLQVIVPPGFETLLQIMIEEFVTKQGTSYEAVAGVSVASWPLLDNQPEADVTSDSTVGQIVLRPISNTTRSRSATIPFAAVPMVVRYNFCGFPNQNCTAQRINLPLDVLDSILIGSITSWDDTRIQAANPNVSCPNVPLQVFYVDYWRNITFDAIPGSKWTAAPLATHVECDSIDAALAFLQLTQGGLAIVPGIRPESTVDDEQTSVALINSFSPQSSSVLSALSSSTANADTDGYMLFFKLELAIPQSFDNCDDLRTNLQVGGFIGSIVVEKISLVSLIVDLSRFFLDFPRAQVSEAIALAPLSQVSKILAETGSTTMFPISTSGRTLDTVNWVSLFSLGNDVAMRSNLFRSLKCSADNSPLIIQEEDLNLLNPLLMDIVGFGLAYVSIALYMVLACWVVRNRTRKIIRFSSPLFLIQILVGATLCICTLFPLSVQDSGFIRELGYSAGDWNYLNTNCAAIPWLYTLGYTLIFAALFLKTWRLLKIFNNPRMRTYHRLKDVHLITASLGFLTVTCILNLIWYYTDRLHWDRVPLQLSQDRLTVLSSVGLCTVNGNPWVDAAPLLVCTLLSMSVGLVLCYRSRSLPSDFQESTWISLSLAIQFQSLLYVLPILGFAGSIPAVSYLCKVIFVFLNSTGTVALIFFPKIWAMYGWNAYHSSSMDKSSSKRSQHRSTSKQYNAGGVPETTNRSVFDRPTSSNQARSPSNPTKQKAVSPFVPKSLFSGSASALSRQDGRAGAESLTISPSFAEEPTGTHDNLQTKQVRRSFSGDRSSDIEMAADSKHMSVGMIDSFS